MSLTETYFTEPVTELKKQSGFTEDDKFFTGSSPDSFINGGEKKNSPLLKLSNLYNLIIKQRIA